MDNGKLKIDNSHWSKQRYQDYKDSGVEWLGEVAKHWEVSRVKNLALLSRGVDLSRDNFVEGSFPVYGSNGIIGYHSQYTTKAPCLTVGRSGSVGEVNYVLKDFWAHNTTLYLQENFNNNVRFIFYLFKSLNLHAFSAGSAVGTLNRNIIHQIKITIPPLLEQKQIARYLDRKTAEIDRKIDLLTQKANKYEELKKSLINETVTRGLDKSVAMKDSGIEWIGKIPKHWEVHRIKDYTYVKGRIGWQGLRNSDFLDQGEFYCVTGTDLINGSIDWSNCYFVSQERYNQDKYIQLKEKDLLITKDGTIGKIALIDKLPLCATLNSGLFVTRPLNSCIGF